MTHFLAMGGYAAYVWPAYGIAGVIILWNTVAAKSHLGTTIKKLRQHYER